MQTQTVRQIKLLFFILLFSSVTYAEGGGHETPAESGGHGAAEGGHGGAEGGGHGGAKPAALPEWVQLQARVATLKAKLAAKEKVVSDLILAKDKEKDAAQSREIVKNIAKEHRELKTMAEEYEQQLSLLKYRFPEKGMLSERSYKRHEVRSLEEMENEVGLSGNLEKTIRMMRQQYQPNGTESSDRAPASLPSVDGKKSKLKEQEEQKAILEPALISK